MSASTFPSAASEITVLGPALMDAAWLVPAGAALAVLGRHSSRPGPAARLRRHRGGPVDER